MDSQQLLIDLAAILAAATPLVFAALGETITERAGVVNISLDGTLLLAGMTGFVVGMATQQVVAGVIAAMLVGVAVAAVLAFCTITLSQSQTAIGLVLAALCTELSSFLGSPYVRQPGVAVPAAPIPLLRDLPLLGPLLFSHDALVYLSFALTPLVWWLLFRTRAGLTLRSLGERPAAAFARGVPVVRLRYLYILVGGALAGLAGAAYTLDFKQGWSYRHIAGVGWIALAIVIFGSWRPWRVVAGCYLFSALQLLATRSQSLFSDLPTQVFQVAPFVVMILVLVLVSAVSSPTFQAAIERLPAALRRPVRWVVGALATPAPAALGQPFQRP